MDTPSTETFEGLRSEFLAKRDSLSGREVHVRSRIIMVKVEARDAVAEADLIHCYLPAGNEVNTLEFVSNLLIRGQRVAVPVYTNNGLVHSEILSLDDLKPTPQGRLQPARDQVLAVSVSDIEVVVVPGVAYGPDGTRVGYADDAYDAFLMEVRCPRVAPVYDFQLSSRLSFKPGLTRVDLIVGETVSYARLFE